LAHSGTRIYFHFPSAYPKLRSWGTSRRGIQQHDPNAGILSFGDPSQLFRIQIRKLPVEDEGLPVAAIELRQSFGTTGGDTNGTATELKLVYNMIANVGIDAGHQYTTGRYGNAAAVMPRLLQGRLRLRLVED